MFPLQAAAKAYLITELGNVFPVEDVTTGQAPINNQGQANHTDAIGLALGQAIVGSGMYLKSVKTPAEYTLVYHGDGHVTTVPLVPYTRLPNDADFAMVHPSDQEIIEINVTRFDAGYSRYDSHTQTLVQNPPYYSEAFSYTDTIRSHGTNMTLYSLSPSLYGNAVYMTTNATSPDFSVTFGTSDMDLIREWVSGNGYFLYHSEGNVTDDNPSYHRSGRKYYWTRHANIDLSPPPGTWFATSGSENLYANASETELFTYSRQRQISGVCTNYESNRTNTVQLDPGIHTARDKKFVLSATDDANGTSISSSLSAYERHERRSNYGCPGYSTYTFYSANATLDMWDRGFRHDPILQVNGTGGHQFTVPYTNDWPLYMIAGPEPVEINMIEFDPASDRFSVGGLPRNVPYVISDGDGNDVAVGVTSGSGSISKTLVSISRDMEPGDGGVLRLYPGAPHYDGYINVVSFDMRNNARVDNHHGSNSTFAYVPVIYARLAFIADAEVDHVTLKSRILGDMNMDHLAGSYLKNQALMVPILPGASALDLTINGFEMSVLVSDMRVEGTSGLIVKETNSYSANTIGNRISAGSTATSNAFAIATSNGTMTADVTVWLTGEAEMWLNTEYVIGADINKRVIRSYHTVRPNPSFAYSFSLYSWPNDKTTKEINDTYDTLRRNNNHSTLSEQLDYLQQEQNTINIDYRRSIDNGLRSLGHGPIGASVDVYKNGDFVKRVDLGGATVPVITHSYSVSALPSDYWPPGTKEVISAGPRLRGGGVIFNSTYPTAGTFTVHQEADVRYLSSTPQALVDVEVETGDMIQFVVQARLSTNVISAPPPVGVTVDLRMHLTDTTITSTGYRDATVTIEGGAINIICCSE